MSEKARDLKGRWRSVSVCFRASPEEVALIDSLVKISGLTKQEYLVRRVTQKDVIIQGNPRVYKALKSQMERIYQELCQLECGDEPNEDLQEIIGLVAHSLGGMIDMPSSHRDALQTLKKKGENNG